MNWLHYLLEANLYLAVAYGCYWLLFRKQTFYTANRIYLLASTVLCFVIPLVQVSSLKPVQPVVQAVQTTANVVYATQTVVAPAANEPILTSNNALQAIYWLVAASMCAWLITKLYSLLKLVFTNKRLSQNNVTLVYLNDEHTPFSFFGYLFVDQSGKLDEAMLRHEMVHIRQKHSWDIIFTEVIKIMNWFNPVVYLLQNSLKALHEFEADRLAAGNQHAPDAYVDFLIAQAYHGNGVPFGHQFSNKQLLKSRIMKLYQKRSGSLARLNYLVALPLCAGLLCASSLAFSKDYGWIKVGIKYLKNSDFNQDSSINQKVNKWAFSVIYKSKMNAYFQFGVKEPNGNITYYKPGTFTDKDKHYLFTNYGMDVKIINEINNISLVDNDTTTVDLPMYGTIDTPKIIKSRLTNNDGLPPPPVISVSKLQSPLKQNPLKSSPPPPPIQARPSPIKPFYKGSKLPPPPPTVERKNTSNKISENGETRKLKGPELKQAVGTVIMGISAEPNEFVKNINNESILRSQAVYIQVDELKPVNIPLYEPVKHGDHLWYTINGQLYDAEALEKRSAAISTDGKLNTLLHAKGTFYHKPQNSATIQKFGKAIGSQGVTEFIDVIWSKL